jgi:Protein of unknown function (DUF4058)
MIVMTPVRAIKNQYRGVNAHLHSYFQAEGGWDEFHSYHIVHMAGLLKTQLLPLGYTAGIERSVRIQQFNQFTRPKSDVTIYDTDPIRPFRVWERKSHETQALTLMDVINLEEESARFKAIGIYEYIPTKGERGDPVAWIELLSPSNKPCGQDMDTYRSKRLKLLKSGIVFIEIDYLHESPPMLENFPRYNTGDPEVPHDPDSHPYHIAVIDPRPEYVEGKVYPYHFDVDQPLPIVDIPLNAGDSIAFDFGTAYDRTFSETMFGIEFIDYSQPPLHFDRYSRADQARILTRMAAIIKGVQDGVDLEKNAPLPTDSLSYDDAIGRIKGWE